MNLADTMKYYSMEDKKHESVTDDGKMLQSQEMMAAGLR